MKLLSWDVIKTEEWNFLAEMSQRLKDGFDIILYMQLFLMTCLMGIGQ